MITKIFDLMFNVIFNILESRHKMKEPFDFRGPVQHGSKEYKQIEEFRTHKIRNSPSSYLVDNEQLEIEKELQIDKRSLHFYLRSGEQVIACLRLTPSPFEVSAIQRWKNTHGSAFEGYYEFSRLCTQVTSPLQARSIARLLINSAYYALTKEKAKGFICLCRSERSSFLQKMGLRIDTDMFWIPQRKGFYLCLSASRLELLCFHFKQIIQKYLTFDSIISKKEKSYL